MRRFRVCHLLTSLLLIQGLALASDPREPAPFVIFETGDAPGMVDRGRLSECLRLTLREMKLEGRELPRIAVYHVSAETGRYLGVDTNSNWRNSGGGQFRYEMWIVGKPSDYLLSYMLENIMQLHFQVAVDEAGRSRIVRHVASGLNATVDVRSLR